VIETADFVVVGGGCMGTSIAMHLARRKVGRVVLLERRTLGSGATGKSTANIRQHYPHPTLARMARNSLKRFQNFAELYGGDAGFVPCGYTNGVGPQDRPALEGIVAMNRSVGVNAHILEPDDLRRLFPGMDLRGVAAGAYEPDAGYADPAVTTMAFGAVARDAGASVREGVEVTGCRTASDRVVGVRTPAGEIAAGAVVLATGCSVGRTLSIPGETLKGCYTGLDFMERINKGERPEIGERVVVLGGGFTSMDCARSAVRIIRIAE